MAEKLKQHLNESSNRNWVRAALSLRYFKQGFETFIDNQIKCQHDDMFVRLKGEKGVSSLQCDRCTPENLLPNHSVFKKCIQKNRRHCFCNQSAFRRICPNKICSILYDYIIQAHGTNDPLWVNTDPSNWSTDHWELGKCFLNTPGYEDKKSAADTDAIGLLSIAINDAYIHDRMDTDIESLIKVKDIRNQILHSPSLSLKDDEVIEYIDEMVKVLQDKKAFGSDTSALEAIQHLTELKNVKCHISFDDELKIREESLTAIEEKTRDAVHSIQVTEANAMDKLKQLQQDQINDLIHREKANRANRAKPKFVTKMATWKQTVAKTSHASKRKQNRYDKEKREIQGTLIDLYKKHYVKTDIIPLIPEVQVDVDSVYVTPQLYTTSLTDYQHYYYNIYGDQKRKYALSEFDFLTNIVNRNILITADAGMGKTTLCFRMISAWCAAHKNEASACSEKTRSNSWCKFFRDIDFLFFISLKYCDEESAVEEMILKVLLEERYRDTVYKLLQSEGNKCLVILDDLNDWTPPAGTSESPRITQGLPLRLVKSRYSTIYTTQPWKLTTIRPMPGDFDMIVDLNGIDPNSSDSFISQVLKDLNNLTHRCRNSDDFLTYFEDKGSAHIRKYPLLMKYVMSIWYEKPNIDTSLTQIYCSVVNIIIDQAFRNGLLSNVRCNSTEAHCDAIELFVDKHYIKRYFDTIVFPLAVFSFHLCKLKRCFHYIPDITDCRGLSDETLKLLTAIDILTEKVSYAKNVLKRCKAISFIHVTFQDLFAAIYLSIHPNKLSYICNNAESILRMKQVFQFLSDLNFCALQIISYITLSIIDNDKNCQDYRCGVSSYLGFVIEIQRMLSYCTEAASKNTNKRRCLALRDMYLGPATAECMSAICNFDFEELKSLHCDIEIPLYAQEIIAKSRNLDMLVCTRSGHLSSAKTQEILIKNESSLKYLKLTGECLSELDISASMFQQLRRIVLSEVVLWYDQFTNLLTNSLYLVEVELNHVTVLTNENESETEDSEDSEYKLPAVSNIQCLKLTSFGIGFNCISLFPALKRLSVERSSPKLLTEMLQKGINLEEVDIHGVTVEADDELTQTFSKLIHLKLLSLNKLKVSLDNLWELLKVVGNRPRAADVKLCDLELEAGCSANDLFQFIHVSKLYNIKTFETSGKIVTRADMISVCDTIEY